MTGRRDVERIAAAEADAFYAENPDAQVDRAILHLGGDQLDVTDIVAARRAGRDEGAAPAVDGAAPSLTDAQPGNITRLIGSPRRSGIDPDLTIVDEIHVWPSSAAARLLEHHEPIVDMAHTWAARCAICLEPITLDDDAPRLPDGRRPWRHAPELLAPVDDAPLATTFYAGLRDPEPDPEPETFPAGTPVRDVLRRLLHGIANAIDPHDHEEEL